MFRDIENHWADALITGAEMAEMANRLLEAQKKRIDDLEGVPDPVSTKSDQYVTRQDAAVLLFKILGLKAWPGAWTPFADAAQIGEFAADAVHTMFKKEVIDGCPGELFRPLAPISRAEFVALLDKSSVLGYLGDVSDGKNPDSSITIIKETRPFGEIVCALAIKYDSILDGSKLATDDYTVEARLGETTETRTITKVYTNDSPSVAEVSRPGSYVVLELAASDKNATTIYFVNPPVGKSNLYKLIYYVSQNKDIMGVDGTLYKPYEQRKSGSEVNAVVDRFKALTYTSRSGFKIDYRLFEPKITPGNQYPLVIFLHGNGERGANGVTQLLGSTGGTVWASDENQAKHPSFVLAPQNPLDPWAFWLDKDVYETTLELIKSVADSPLIDPKRIYITGLSMGGFGTWGFLQRDADLFAAGMPVAGGADISNLEVLKDKPIWAFTSADDPIVKVSGEMEYMQGIMNGTRDLVAALKAVGSSKIKYTEYEEGYVSMPLAPNAHFSWIPAYDTQEAIEWLFEQTNLNINN